MLLRLKVIGLLLPMLLLITEVHAHDERVKESITTSYHQFQTIENLIVIEASLNGQKGHYILDTGSSGLVLNTRQFPNESDRPQAILAASGATIQASSSIIKNFRLGHLNFDNLPVAHMPLNLIEERMGIELHGLIGMDVLSTTDIYIDYDAQWIILQDDADIKESPDFEIPISQWENVPMIQVEWNDVHLNMALDIGATRTLIDQSIASKHQLKAVDYTYLQGGDQQVNKVDIVQVHDMQIGDLLYNSEALTVDLSDLSDDQMTIHGLIGNDFLKNRKVLISMRSKVMKVWE